MEQVEQYLIFGKGDIWTSMLLHKEYGHIRILFYDGFNWLLINPSYTHLEWEILPIALGSNPLDTLFMEDKIVLLNDIHKKKSWVGKLGIMSCVLLVKYIFGISSWSQTPYQLYKYILKHELGEDYGRIK